MGDYTPHWEGFGRIPPQGGPQAYRTTTSERGGAVGKCILHWRKLCTTGLYVSSPPDPPCLSHFLQVPWDIPLRVAQRLDGRGAQPSEGATEVGAAVQDVEQGWRECLDLGDNLRGGG